MILKPAVFDGGQQRQVQPGDVVGGGEVIVSVTTAGAATLLGAALIAGIIRRTGPTGAFNETTDSAANIIAALIGNYGYNTSGAAGLVSSNGVQPGTTWRLRYLNTVAQIGTLLAGTGITLGVNTATINASSVKDFLFTVLNGTPSQIFTANTTNASPAVTGLLGFQTSQLTPGMLVTGTGIPASTIVIAVIPGIGVTLSANATATGIVALTFSPQIQIDGLGQGLL